MKLKAFDFENILYQSDHFNFPDEEIKQKLNPYVLYFKKNDTIGICFKENKNDIMKVLKEYGKTEAEGHFVDLDKFFTDDDFDWDNIYMGEIQLEGTLCWKEFGKLLKLNEDSLLSSYDKFEENWYAIQRSALRKVLDNRLGEMKRQLEDDIQEANYYYNRHLGIHELRPK